MGPYLIAHPVQIIPSRISFPLDGRLIVRMQAMSPRTNVTMPTSPNRNIIPQLASRFAARYTNKANTTAFKVIPAIEKTIETTLDPDFDLFSNGSNPP